MSHEAHDPLGLRTFAKEPATLQGLIGMTEWQLAAQTVAAHASSDARRRAVG
jgi:hypothetical protein